MEESKLIIRRISALTPGESNTVCRGTDSVTLSLLSLRKLTSTISSELLLLSVVNLVRSTKDSSFSDSSESGPLYCGNTHSSCSLVRSIISLLVKLVRLVPFNFSALALLKCCKKTACKTSPAAITALRPSLVPPNISFKP